MKVSYKGFLVSIVLTFFIFHDSSSLSLSLQNAHFKMCCVPEDRNVSKELLQQLEDLYSQLSKDFNTKYSCMISIEIYPNLTAFHNAIHEPSAPDWIVAEANSHIIKGVSPAHPGPVHSTDGMFMNYRVCLVHLFLMDNKERFKDVPYWLAQGVALYKGGKVYNQIKEEVPTIAQLDAVKDSALEFKELNGFAVSYFLVDFIDKNWGKDTLLKLLENYSQFQEIIGLTKEELRRKFIQSLK